MSNAQRIRGENTALVVIVDGQEQAGSFNKVEGFEWKPLADIVDSDFLDESESDFDVQHNGYECTFTIHEQENSAVDNILLPLVAKLKAGDTMPSVTLVFIKSYRDPALPVKTLEFQNMKLIMTGQNASERKGYVKTSFMGRCRTMESA